MDTKIAEIFEAFLNNRLEQIIISNAIKGNEIQKIKIQPFINKKELLFQITKYIGTKVFHENCIKEELLLLLPEWFQGMFTQVQLESFDGLAMVLVSKKGKATIKQKKKDLQSIKKTCQLTESLSHNRSKQYIFSEGTPIPFLVDLGVMTKEGKVVASKYDKFRQINRYLEFIEDVLVYFSKEEQINILDFGCGKSYLTFAMYHYLKEMKGYQVSITGLDLKEDVIKRCNALKDQYGYEGLHFIRGDIAEYSETNKIDMVVSLHACDTATDYAIAKAILWGARVIFAVPCCQHELNGQIACEELGSILKYGLLKERLSALYTDGLRANLLEILNYKVQVMEFIDLEHTPKNILIRAVKSKTLLGTAKREQKRCEYLKNIEFLKVKPMLYQLCFEERMEDEGSI